MQLFQFSQVLHWFLWHKFHRRIEQYSSSLTTSWRMDSYITDIANSTLSLSMQVISRIELYFIKTPVQLDNQCLMQAEQPKKNILGQHPFYFIHTHLYTQKHANRSLKACFKKTENGNTRRLKVKHFLSTKPRRKQSKTSHDIQGSEFYTHHQLLFPSVCNTAILDFNWTMIQFSCFKWKNCETGFLQWGVSH